MALQDTSLISTLAAGFGLALGLGYVATRLRMPALVGYLLAGIAIGPFTPGFVADTALAGQLAEIGVMLLMFGVGLHFSLGDLMAVRRIAVPGAIVQMAAATAMGAGLAVWWGWSAAAALVFGLALSVASTVVLLRALEARGQLDSHNGRIAVGWLVVEDLAMVLVLVMLPALAGLPSAADATGGARSGWLALSMTLAQVAAFVALMLLAGRKLFPWLLWQVTRAGSRELFTLAVVASAVGLAFGAAQLFGVSFALGAFFAGMVLRESPLSHRAAEESLPLRDAFAVLFFVSVGMLFDPSVLVERPAQVLAVLGIIVLGKSLAACALVLLLRYPLGTALTVSVSLAQIGEFSFILVGLGTSLGVLPAEGRSLVLAAAILSIALNPLLFAAVEPLRGWLLVRSSLARRLNAPHDPLAELPLNTQPRFLSRQVVLVGYGRIGERIARRLQQHDLPFVVADRKRERVEALRQQQLAAVSGDATDEGVLIQAHIARARLLVITVRDAAAAQQMIDIARMINPGIRIAACCAHPDEQARLQANTGVQAFLVEEELARALSDHILLLATDQPAEAARLTHLSG